MVFLVFGYIMLVLVGAGSTLASSSEESSSSHSYSSSGGHSGKSSGGYSSSESSETDSDDLILTDLIIGELPSDLEEANLGAFEGGENGDEHDPAIENVIQEEDQLDNGKFNIPSNGPPSPLYDAEPFSQQMLRFEEFGTDELELSTSERDIEERRRFKPFPAPKNTKSYPKSTKLERFLRQDINPLPQEYSNVEDSNPWQYMIENYLGYDLEHPPAEGRPPQANWAHQRWEEFTPERYTQTVQTGARRNKGLRDRKQSHRYRKGEFARGGLYHIGGSTQGIKVKFHPDMPTQKKDALWTFDGTFPPKLLKARYGVPLVFRHYNGLPIDVSSNRGFGLHTITTHEHNGHTPGESDGYANAFFFPGQYYDYRWPIALAGHDTINTNSDDWKAGSPDGQGGINRIPGDYRETMSTHWFHDHMLDFTAQNVYKGNAAMMNYYSALDRGNEDLDDGVNLRFPSGSDLDWGNRDYDVNIMVADKAWDQQGQLWFNLWNQDGFLGDVMTVNWLYKPTLDVRARRYRFRILDASVSRYFKIAVTTEYGLPVPFYMIANDGNIMEHTVYFEDGILPTIGVAERYDIIIDFSNFDIGDKIYFVNILQHKTGKSTDAIIPVEDIFNGNYVPEIVNDDGVMTWNKDPCVGKFLEMVVNYYPGNDNSMDPAAYLPGGLKMIPIRRPSEEELENALHRTFEFEHDPVDNNPWGIATDETLSVGMDPRRLSAAPSKNADHIEVWRLVNSGTWSHPVHIHFEEGIVLRRNGVAPPEWEKWARKDVYRIGPDEDSGVMVEIAFRWRDFMGSYMEHCHNTQHEDHKMLLRYDVENPGQLLLLPAPIPTWDGVTYENTHALPTFREGEEGGGQFGPTLTPTSVWLEGAVLGDIVDLDTVEIGDALNPTPDERASLTIPLIEAKNIDNNGVESTVYFILHDCSDEDVSEDFGIAWAGALTETPPAALSDADYVDGEWTFYGDLPNPVGSNTVPFPDGVVQSADNDYYPLRKVLIDGEEIIFNCIFIHWGDEWYNHLRIDENCNLPDDPPNVDCMYNGQAWKSTTGHAIAIDVESENPTVTMKLHKSWAEGGDYLAYYIVVDTFPLGPADGMGIPYVPKHAFVGRVAVPLVQFIPSERLNPTYPPTDTMYGYRGGGPLGGQIGLPSYFMPEDDYSPMWHIGFAVWQQEPTEVVLGLERVQELREEGLIQIHEFPAVIQPDGSNPADGYDFDNEFSPHVVNCPVPVTVDVVVHQALALSNQKKRAAYEASQKQKKAENVTQEKKKFSSSVTVNNKLLTLSS